jgi:alpha-galactosidase
MTSAAWATIIKKESNGDAAKYFELEKAAYDKMHKALVATGRPIVFSLCQYGFQNVWEWGPSVGGNLWRTTGDISDNYDRMSVIGFQQSGLGKYAAPGHWNDPDMLEVGNGGMNHNEYITHMTLMGHSCRSAAGRQRPEQDDGRHQGDSDQQECHRRRPGQARQAGISRLGGWAARDLGEAAERGAKAVALFNRGESTSPITLELKSVGFGAGAKLHDLWSDKDVSASGGSYTGKRPQPWRCVAEGVEVAAPGRNGTF